MMFTNYDEPYRINKTREEKNTSEEMRKKNEWNNKIERKSYNFVLTREMANLSGV